MSTFIQQAKDIAAKVAKHIVLIDRLMLARLMINFGVGVSNEMVYGMKPGYPEIHNEMSMNAHKY